MKEATLAYPFLKALLPNRMVVVLDTRVVARPEM